MKNQYAYTEELSTTDALVKFSSDTSAGLNKTDTVTLQALLLDFSKAFDRSEEHTSELQSPVPISYAVFCLKKKNTSHTVCNDIHNFFDTHDRQTFMLIL